jgi:RNA polymerase sigma-70 factor (ECF subfamily)
MPPEPRRPQFPSTQWSRILTPGGRGGLETLARSYAPAIEAFLQARLRCSAHDAADLAQEAFAWMLQSDLLGKADPARGRFRGFLKKALGNFAIEHLRRQQAHKRGGGRIHEPLEAAADVADAQAPTPEQALDQAWRRDLLERARDALRTELCGNERQRYWQLFDGYLLQDDPPTHAQLAEQHGITRTDVSNWLDHAKRRYRVLLRDLVAETVDDQQELDAELQWLFGGSS